MADEPRLVPRTPAISGDVELAQAFHAGVQRIEAQLSKRIIGQQPVVELLLTALFARGHGLFIGVPGLAKTLLISTLAETLSLRFSRVQFTPDLRPTDITGTEILQRDATTGERVLRFVRGPVFCNLLLADEVNRTSPKTQAALLQAMQEYSVTAGGETHAVDRPFVVFATQNPIEQEGTYPLPEAQLDRFMLSIRVPYPEAEEELEIVRRTTAPDPPQVEKALDPEEITAFQDLVLRVPVADAIMRYAVAIVRRTRPENPDSPDEVRTFLNWGAGPRAAQHLVLAAKAWALIHGEFAVSSEDIRTLAAPVLGHRLITNFHAESEGVSVTEILAKVVETTTV